MLHLIKTASAILLTACAATPSKQPPAPPEVATAVQNETTGEQFRSAVEADREALKIPEDGKLLWTEGCGYADLENTRRDK